jgi:hypothetical protein
MGIRDKLVGEAQAERRAPGREEEGELPSRNMNPIGLKAPRSGLGTQRGAYQRYKTYLPRAASSSTR